MTPLAAVVAQLGTDELLNGKVGGAAALAKALQQGAAAQAMTGVYVIPVGLRGGAADAMAGMFTQGVDQMIGVVIRVRNVSDATGAAAQAELEPLIDAVIGVIAGWAPDEETTGTFVLSRGQLISIDTGTITYQLDFGLDDQLRIAR